MEITAFAIEEIKDPTNIIEGKRYEFLLDVEVEVEDDDNPETGDANDLAGLLFLLGAATVTGAACYKRKKAC